MLKKIKWLWRYRDLIRELTIKELKLRYKNSALGFLWSFLNPLFMMLVYFVVFGKIFPQMRGANYPVYLLSGLLLWNFFSISLINSAYSLIHNASLIKKIYFPREVFPIATVLSNLINFLLSLIPFFIILAIFHRKIFNLNLLFAPIAIFFLFVMTIGFAFIISVISVYFRDFIQIMENLLLAWFFISPIIYKEELILSNSSEKIKILYKLNPLYPIIEIFHSLFYIGKFPDIKTIYYCALISLFVFILGWIYFQRYEDKFVKLL